MPMQIVETTITPLTVKLTVANDPDKALATECLSYEFQMARDENQYLGEVHQAALRRVQEIVGSEIRRLRELAGRTA